MDGASCQRPAVTSKRLGFATLIAGSALLVSSCAARAEPRSDGRSQPPDGPYPNASVEGRKVPMVHVKDAGETVLVDTVGKTPRVWMEQFRRLGELPEGVYNLHKTHVDGHENFRDIPVDRHGVWTIDKAGNVTAVATSPTPPDGAYANVTIEGRVVPMIHIKDHGATLLVDTEGRTPRVWAEQFRRHGDLPDGVYNIHKTHVEGHEDFHDIAVDRKGLWTVDASGNLTAH